MDIEYLIAVIEWKLTLQRYPRYRTNRAASRRRACHRQSCGSGGVLVQAVQCWSAEQSGGRVQAQKLSPSPR